MFHRKVAMALEWQRMFPSRTMNPIASMEYDREMLRKIGGQLVVLRSQTKPGVTVCQVALRLAGHEIDDLTPAYKRT